MCGIAGWYRRGERAVARATVEAQCDAILHRGPDEGGAFTDGSFGFGMRRLSILDIAGVGKAVEWRRYAMKFDNRPLFDAEAPMLPGFERKAEFVL